MSKIKIAYLLLVHKCPEQVNQYINQLLNYGDCDVYVHVDMKQRKIAEQIIKNERVIVCSVYDVRWGSFEIVKAAYYLMGLAAKSGRQYTHMCLGSGQDLIVRKGLYEYLGKKPDKIFIRIEGKVLDRSRAASRFKVCWPKKLMIRNDMHPFRFIRIGIQLLCRIGIVLFPNKVRLKKSVFFYEGRTWFIVPANVAEYILKYIENNPDYVDFWKNSLASDLLFFQTIIMNSPYRDKIEDELMYVNFGKTFRAMNHPVTVQISDDKKIQSGTFFLARKFEWDEKETIDYFLDKVNKG